MNTKQPLLAWHNDPELKREAVARMLQHRVEDSIIQEMYQEVDPDLASGYRGCLIGCTLPLQSVEGAISSSELLGWHEKVTKLYGIDTSVVFILERVFEGVTSGEAADFAVNSIVAIPVGADLSRIPYQLAYDTLVYQTEKFNNDFLEEVKDWARTYDGSPQSEARRQALELEVTDKNANYGGDSDLYKFLEEVLYKEEGYFGFLDNIYFYNGPREELEIRRFIRDRFLEYVAQAPVPYAPEVPVLLDDMTEVRI